MKKLRNKFERFCYENRNKGIPNLMLYIVIGNAIVLFMSMVNGGVALYNLLCFDKGKILQGQVWRLFSYVFTQSGTGILELLFLYFFYRLGRYVELSMGTFKFNLFYLCGVLFMDIFAMIFCPANGISLVYGDMSYYLHLSLILAFATTHPDAQFMLFFIIPVKAWVLALIDLLLVLISVFNLSYPIMYFPHNLFPLVALGNYFLFFSADLPNIFPVSWRANFSRLFRKKPKTQTGKKPIIFPTAGSYEATTTTQRAPYTHRCTICGKTDISHPDVEFRYCSRCNGYYCYCEEHINNHTHIS